MKKFLNVLPLIILLFTVFSILPVQAEVIPAKVYAVVQHSFSCQETKENQKIELLSYSSYGLEDIVIKEGDTLTITLDEYVCPKRGKRDGYYKITLTHIEHKNIKNYDYHGTMRVSEPKDMSEIAEKAGITIAGAVLKVPGFSQGIAAAKGIISPNENESRLQSAGKNIYESTPLTYAEKGNDFTVEENSIVVLKLKKK